MRNRLIASLILLLFLSLSAPASAQGNSNGNGNGKGNGNGGNSSENSGNGQGNSGQGNSGNGNNGNGNGNGNSSGSNGNGNSGNSNNGNGQGNGNSSNNGDDDSTPGGTLEDVVPEPADPQPSLPAEPKAISGNGERSALKATQSGKAAPLEQLLPDVRAATGGDVIDAQLVTAKGFLLYEIKVLTPAGKVMTQYYYARSGRPVQVR